MFQNKPIKFGLLVTNLSVNSNSKRDAKGVRDPAAVSPLWAHTSSLMRCIIRNMQQEQRDLPVPMCNPKLLPQRCIFIKFYMQFPRTRRRTEEPNAASWFAGGAGAEQAETQRACKAPGCRSQAIPFQVHTSVAVTQQCRLKGLRYCKRLWAAKIPSLGFVHFKLICSPAF